MKHSAPQKSCSKDRKAPQKDINIAMRILVTRTDRLGDVVLSTPAIKALRQRFPEAHIAFMVRPYTREIVAGNPYLDEVIIYDKYGKQKSLLNTLRFALKLRKKKFDLALMLHPTSRVHIISFIAGIPRRIGYDRKFSFLLTDKFAHNKQKGEFHESEYTLGLLSMVGINTTDKTLFVPVNPAKLEKVEHIFKKFDLDNGSPVIVINPGASCLSKRWDPHNFSVVADELVRIYNAKIITVSDKANEKNVETMKENMTHALVDLSGKTTLGELAAVLSKSDLLISNDSGTIHIACALGVPTVSIFGRKDPGLSPKRWGPLGKSCVVLHKDVGCKRCFAHNCKIGFKCLEAIMPEEVIKSAGVLLKSRTGQ